MKFSIKDFFRKCDQIHRKFAFIEVILNEKLHFLWSACFADHSFKTHMAYLSTLLKLMWPIERSNFYIRDNVGIKLLVKLLIGFSHLSEQKFRHNFKDIVTLLFCSIEVESILNFLQSTFFFRIGCFLSVAYLTVDNFVRLGISLRCCV